MTGVEGLQKVCLFSYVVSFSFLSVGVDLPRSDCTPCVFFWVPLLFALHTLYLISSSSSSCCFWIASPLPRVLVLSGFPTSIHRVLCAFLFYCCPDFLLSSIVGVEFVT